MSDKPIIVIDRETGQPVVGGVQTLHDAHGHFNPEDERWQDRYYIQTENGNEEVHEKPTEIQSEILDLIAFVEHVRDALEDLYNKVHEL